MKKCVKCGRTAENNNHSVCGYCGGNLVKDEGVRIGGEDRDDFTVVPQKKKSNNVLIVLVVIVLVGAIGLCCFLMGKLYNKEDNITNEKETTETTKQASFEKIPETDKAEEKSENEENSESVQPEIARPIPNDVQNDFDPEAEIKRIREELPLLKNKREDLYEIKRK